MAIKETPLAQWLMPALLLLLPGCGDVQSDLGERIAAVPFTSVHFSDEFWAPRMEVNRTVSIPSAFQQCEANGRFDNFAIAGGLKQGEHRGDFSFDDTDPYKVIEGASYSLAVRYDAALDAYLDSVIALIAAAQEPDGYLTTCVTNKCERLSGWWGTSKWEKINSHELYNSGHMYEAAVAHFLATGKRAFLDVAIKNADLVCQVFGPEEGQKHVPSGHPIVEMALCKLYQVTGNERYLRTAQYFVEETGRCSDGHRPSEYSQDHKPILEQDEIVGHAVRAGYLFSGVADVAALTHSADYFAALERLWQNCAGRKLYITGGIGSRAQGEGFGPDYELNNHTAYCETCAAIANVYWNHRMFLATGDAKYADVVERALYNGVISGVSLSGDKFFYDNPLESMGQHERAPWFGCACCPGNVTRFVASVPGYMYATDQEGIYVNLYAQSAAEVGDVTLRQTTRYPWEGAVELAVEATKEAPWTLRLRLPGWTGARPVATDLYSFAEPARAAYTLAINGAAEVAHVQDGYVCIRRAWHAGDVVRLELPMEVRRVQARPEVADDRGKMCLERGPIVYCVEGADVADGEVFDKYLPADAPLTAAWEGDLLGGVVTLRGLMRQVTPDDSAKEVELKAIPYATWCNRGSDQMAVWLPTAANGARVKPAPSIASQATAFQVSRPIQKDATAEEHLTPTFGVNDQWDPASSADNSKPYQYWWLREGTEESLVYTFDRSHRVSSVDVYWLAFDHYDVIYRAPTSWRLFYQDAAGDWQPVEDPSTFGVEPDKYNHVSFKPVNTSSLKLTAQLQKGASGGVIEWKVGGE